MKTRMRPSPALVIALIALFVALGGTSYAAITALPANSVGTKQLKNGAVTSAKLSGAVLRSYRHSGGTLPPGVTEVGDWGFGTVSAGALGAGSDAHPAFTFPVPLAKALDPDHVVYVSNKWALECPGAGHAAPGYLCVYQTHDESALTPTDGSIFDPETSRGFGGTGKYGWAIALATTSTGEWSLRGTYAVTAP